VNTDYPYSGVTTMIIQIKAIMANMIEYDYVNYTGTLVLNFEGSRQGMGINGIGKRYR
jgi:hypothetical protein